jgi:hypothetical protein
MAAAEEVDITTMTQRWTSQCSTTVTTAKPNPHGGEVVISGNKHGYCSLSWQWRPTTSEGRCNCGSLSWPLRPPCPISCGGRGWCRGDAPREVEGKAGKEQRWRGGGGRGAPSAARAGTWTMLFVGHTKHHILTRTKARYDMIIFGWCRHNTNTRAVSCLGYWHDGWHGTDMY